jgi:hypothetical protein
MEGVTKRLLLRFHRCRNEAPKLCPTAAAHPCRPALELQRSIIMLRAMGDDECRRNDHGTDAGKRISLSASAAIEGFERCLS